MTQETWRQFRTGVYLRKLNVRLTEDSYSVKEMFFDRTWSHHTRMWWKAVKFIEKLLENKVSLDQIDINDFESAWPCRVYVGIGKRSYTRFAKNDYKLALKHLKKL